jgi:uncharacterized protein DUF1707
MAFEPSLRIGDRERDAVAAELQEHYAHGRLTLEEFNQRIDAVFAAKTQADLNRITRDLPHVRDWGQLPGSAARASALQPSGAGVDPVAASWAGPVWAGPGSQGGWQGTPGGRPGSRGGYAFLVMLMSALATWYLVYDVLLVGMRVPFAGRLGLLVAIYTIIKALLRRIFRRRR